MKSPCTARLSAKTSGYPFSRDKPGYTEFQDNQALSNAGKRKGFDDARGTLFFEIARLAEARAQVCVGQSFELPQRAMALSPAASGGRTAGIEQQPGRAQHQALLIGRKNFLFANTPLGAQVSAVIYSLIETVRETGLDPFCYLTWVLKTIPMLDRIVEGWAGPLLPANTPESCPTT